MKMDVVAAELLGQARQKPGEVVRMRLERGLVISAKRVDRQWHLAAARVDVYPGTEEAVIVARAFGVPLGTEPEWVVRKQRTALATLDWYGVVWQWMEVEREAQGADLRQGVLLEGPGVYV